MAKQDPWFIQERAVAFASLLLTKRNDVVVRPHAGTDRGIDLLVEILKDGKPSLRFFGVQLVGSIDLPDIQGADERIAACLPGNPSEATFPLCVFAIGVRKPEGIYRWVIAPVVDGGQAQLHQEGQADWQTLDAAGAARLIGQVNAWYDAFNGGTAKSRDRHVQTES